MFHDAGKYQPWSSMPLITLFAARWHEFTSVTFWVVWRVDVSHELPIVPVLVEISLQSGTHCLPFMKLLINILTNNNLNQIL